MELTTALCYIPWHCRVYRNRCRTSLVPSLLCRLKFWICSSGAFFHSPSFINMAPSTSSQMGAELDRETYHYFLGKVRRESPIGSSHMFIFLANHWTFPNLFCSQYFFKLCSGISKLQIGIENRNQVFFCTRNLHLQMVFLPLEKTDAIVFRQHMKQ